MTVCASARAAALWESVSDAMHRLGFNAPFPRKRIAGRAVAKSDGHFFPSQRGGLPGRATESGVGGFRVELRRDVKLLGLERILNRRDVSGAYTGDTHVAGLFEVGDGLCPLRGRGDVGRRGDGFGGGKAQELMEKVDGAKVDCALVALLLVVEAADDECKGLAGDVRGGVGGDGDGLEGVGHVAVWQGVEQAEVGCAERDGGGGPRWRVGGCVRHGVETVAAHNGQQPR